MQILRIHTKDYQEVEFHPISAIHRIRFTQQDKDDWELMIEFVNGEHFFCYCTKSYKEIFEHWFLYQPTGSMELKLFEKNK